jgi:hypothetical protein
MKFTCIEHQSAGQLCHHFLLSLLPGPPFCLTCMQCRATPPDVYKAQFAELLDKYHIHLAMYSDGLELGDSIVCAAVTHGDGCTPLPDGASVFTAGLVAICLAMNVVNRGRQQSFNLLWFAVIFASCA